MSTFRAGASEVAITPPLGVEMAGFASRKGVAQGVRDELKALAVVFDDGARKSGICVADLVGVKPALVQAVRARVSRQTGIPPERLMIAATHDHSGPTLGGDNPLNRQWLKDLESRLTEVIAEADAGRREARIGVAVGRVEGVGGNRRDPRNGPVDRSVTVMRIDDAADGRAMAVIVNHACHATTLGGDNLQLTPDYPGYARAAVKAGLPDHPTVLFLNGACGDVNPGGYSAEASALGKFIPNRTFERAEAIGRTIGAEVVRLATSLGTEGRVCVQGGARTLRLPLKALPTPAEAEAELRKAVARLASARRAALPEAQIDRAAMDLIYAQTHADQSRRLSGSPNGELASDIQGIAVGDILFLGLPGEVFTEIGLTLKRSSGFAHTFIVAYANDSAGYIPTAEALRGGDGYEVIVSVLGPAAIDRFIEGAVSLAGEIRERMR